MELPNIYAGDYRRLAAIPLVLVLISLYFITQIELGLEFRGGVLVTLELDREYSGAEISSLIADAGFTEASVRAYELGDLHIAEVEIAHSSEMVGLESSYRSFLDTYDRYSKKQYELLVLKSSNASTPAKEAELESLRQELLSIKDSFSSRYSEVTGRKASLPAGIDALKPAVEAHFSEAMQVYRGGIMSRLQKHISYSSHSFKLISPSLSELFVGKIEWVMLAAAILCSVGVFIMFRDPVPSAAVLIGAACDIIFALGAMGLFGIPLSLAAIASILMLIGFSLDTDVLLTVRILKRGLKDPRSSAHEAMKTGMMMSITAIIAFSALFMVGSITNISVYQSISQIVLAGLIGDLIATWMLNAVIMIHHVEGVRSARAFV